jgi:hypothetical protein
MALCSSRLAMLKRARSMACRFSSSVISRQAISTLVTPGSEPTRLVMSRWSWARSGHPAVVRATVTTTVPSGRTSTWSPTMPSSTTSLPNSGSMTPRRAVTTSELATTAGILPAKPV